MKTPYTSRRAAWHGSLLAGLLSAGAASADPVITLSVGLPAAELDFRLRASDRLAFGARVAWDQLDREESLSLGAAGVAAPVRLDLALSRFGLSLEAAPGVRRLTGRFRDAGCGCIVDAAPAVALQLPVSAGLRAPLSDAAGLTLFSTLGSDLLLSGGLLVSPQAGLAIDAAVSGAISLGLTARGGRVLALGSDPPILGGRRAITMPLALLLTLAVRP